MTARKPGYVPRLQRVLEALHLGKGLKAWMSVMKLGALRVASRVCLALSMLAGNPLSSVITARQGKSSRGRKKHHEGVPKPDIVVAWNMYVIRVIKYGHIGIQNVDGLAMEIQAEHQVSSARNPY